jgi:hypothetical protein
MLTPRLAYEDTSDSRYTDVLEAGSRKKPIPATNRLQSKSFNPSFSAQALVATSQTRRIKLTVKNSAPRLPLARA